MGQAALQVLQAVKGPVGVVAVSGRARQGKSFILNQLLGSTSGFSAPLGLCSLSLEASWLWQAVLTLLLGLAERCLSLLLGSWQASGYGRLRCCWLQLAEKCDAVCSCGPHAQALHQGAVDVERACGACTPRRQQVPPGMPNAASAVLHICGLTWLPCAQVMLDTEGIDAYDQVS